MFSPTNQVEWNRCPYRARLFKEGWRKPTDWELEPYRWIGQVVHAGLEQYFSNDEERRPFDRGQALMAMDRMWDEVWRDAPREGGWDLRRAVTLATRALEAVLSTKYGHLTYRDVVATETTMGGVGRKDLVYVATDGVVVVDWKVRRKLPYDMSAWDTDWQIAQYMWEVAQAGRGPCVRGEVCVVALEPKVAVTIHEVPWVAERMAKWHEGARAAWDDRTRYALVGEHPQRWTGCHGSHRWPCEFIGHCHEGAALEVFYEREVNTRSTEEDMREGRDE